MSLAIPTKRVVSAGKCDSMVKYPPYIPLTKSGLRNSLHPPSPGLPLLGPSLVQRRNFLERFRGRKKETNFLDPSSPDLLKRPPAALLTPPTLGDLAPSSILNVDQPPPSQKSSDRPPSQISSGPSKPNRNPIAMAAALDPTPHARKRWQRKMLIRDIRGRFRMSKTIKILRTERFSVSKSELFKTSVKKLGPLARQIAGKPIEDAIVQMRFSKKKAAAEVKKHLEYARDEAIVRRGMGLGKVKLQETQEGEEAVAQAPMKPIVVEDRKGKRRTVTDLSSIYVDQAWVGRGKYGREPEFRARGRVNLLRPPYTRRSFLTPSFTAYHK